MTIPFHIGSRWRGASEFYSSESHGYTSLKKTLPLAGSMGNVMWLVAFEPGTVTQLAPRPALNEFVCTCKLHVKGAFQVTTICPLPCTAVNPMGAGGGVPKTLNS